MNTMNGGSLSNLGQRCLARDSAWCQFRLEEATSGLQQGVSEEAECDNKTYKYSSKHTTGQKRKKLPQL